MAKISDLNQICSIIKEAKRAGVSSMKIPGVIELEFGSVGQGTGSPRKQNTKLSKQIEKALKDSLDEEKAELMERELEELALLDPEKFEARIAEGMIENGDVD